MPCASPLTAYRPASGGPLSFNVAPPKDGRAWSETEVPCGTCILCRQEQARQWAVRITHEATLHAYNSFVTLTYEDAHLPEHNSLDYRHLQTFWKRLRKAVGKLRYYAVGEYGDATLRPHYHACIFGHAFCDQRSILREHPTLLWTNPTLQKAWGLGNVSIGTLNYETARYTASYVTKKLRAKQQYVRIEEETGELIPLVQPRAFMSLRPAIGAEWLKKWGDHVYEGDRVVINGQPQKPPKYYDRWLEKRSRIALQMVKQFREEKTKTKPTDKEIRARTLIAHTRIKQKATTI